MPKDDRRSEWIAAAMRGSEFQAIVSSAASTVLLLSGYWPIMGASVVIVDADGHVTVIVPEDEMELASASSSAHLIPYTAETLEHLDSPLEAIGEALKPVLAQLNVTGKSAAAKAIGVDKFHTMQPASYAAAVWFHTSLNDLLQTLLPDATLIASAPLLEPLKAIRTPVELALMQTAADIAADGFAEAARCIAPGLRENEIAARVQAAFEASPRSADVKRSYGFFYCMSGPNSATASAAYARTRTRMVEEGDLVMIHANTCADGFWTDITRTYTAGQPVKRHDEMRAAILEARSHALAAIKPGAHASDVDTAAREVMKAHGYGEAFRHATGHGVGFAAANANALPRIHPKSPDLLVEAMTFNIEPAAYFAEYGGMRHCDVVAVTANGARVLTEF
jgi:Xaa-Pro aminopeptidase